MKESTGIRASQRAKKKLIHQRTSQVSARTLMVIHTRRLYGSWRIVCFAHTDESIALGSPKRKRVGESSQQLRVSKCSYILSFKKNLRGGGRKKESAKNPRKRTAKYALNKKAAGQSPGTQGPSHFPREYLPNPAQRSCNPPVSPTEA